MDLLKYFSSTILGPSREELQTLLFAAVQNNDLDRVQSLINSGISADGTDNAGRTPLFEAVRCGHYHLVKFLIQQGSLVNHAAKNKETPLILAAKAGYLNIVQLLIENYATVNYSDVNGYTALHNAATQGHYEVVEHLIQHGANINSQNRYGRTALFVTVKAGKIEIVKFLIKQDVDIHQKDCYGETILFDASRFGHTDIIRLLIEHGANVSHHNRMGETALFILIRYYNQPLLIAGFNGIKHEHFNIMGLFIAKGALASASDAYGISAMTLACQSHTATTITCLIHWMMRAGQQEDLVKLMQWKEATEGISLVNILLSAGLSCHLKAATPSLESMIKNRESILQQLFSTSNSTDHDSIFQNLPIVIQCARAWHTLQQNSKLTASVEQNTGVPLNVKSTLLLMEEDIDLDDKTTQAVKISNQLPIEIRWEIRRYLIERYIIEYLTSKLSQSVAQEMLFLCITHLEYYECFNQRRLTHDWRQPFNVETISYTP